MRLSIFQCARNVLFLVGWEKLIYVLLASLLPPTPFSSTFLSLVSLIVGEKKRRKIYSSMRLVRKVEEKGKSICGQVGFPFWKHHCGVLGISKNWGVVGGEGVKDGKSIFILCWSLKHWTFNFFLNCNKNLLFCKLICKQNSQTSPNEKLNKQIGQFVSFIAYFSFPLY